jgi:hypothetical protein
MNMRIRCYTIAEPSTAMYSPSAMVDFDGGTLTLRYDYYRYRDDQLVGIFRSGLRFQEVRAHRHRAESHCTAWHLNGAYDTLVEIEDSEWVADLKAISQGRYKVNWEMHHYMIYLDSAGCYEVVAKSWEVLPEEEGAWDRTI